MSNYNDMLNHHIGEIDMMIHHVKYIQTLELRIFDIEKQFKNNMYYKHTHTIIISSLMIILILLMV